MPLYLDEERATSDFLWTTPEYAESSPGLAVLPQLLDMLGTTMHGTVLDAGCGSGRLAVALQAEGFRVTCCDLTAAGLIPAARALPFRDACFWHHLPPTVGFHDWVVCTDVLEHVPEALTMLVVSRLLAVAKRGVFLSIDLEPDVYGYWAGRPLHRTVRPFTWWRDLLAEIATVVECRDLLEKGLYLLGPSA